MDATTTNLRPVAHFTAPGSWLNDPNGMLFHKGLWHLCYQTNPRGSTWGNLSWGHAVSGDLVTWRDQGLAIECTPTEHVYSGSSVVDDRNSAGFAGAGETAIVAVYTSAYTGASPRSGVQAQSLAVSIDDGASWHRYAGNPVLDIDATDMRDPKVFWWGDCGGHWVMIVAEAEHQRVAVHSSDDLKNWRHESTFTVPGLQCGIWECPDLFPLAVPGSATVSWVLVLSMQTPQRPGVRYLLGDFDGREFTLNERQPSSGEMEVGWLDHGHDFYAASSFNGTPGNRRIVMAWAADPLYAQVTPVGPWRGAMTLARELRLVRVEGRLRLAQRPILPPADATPPGMVVFTSRLFLADGFRHRVTLTNDYGDIVSVVVDADPPRLTVDRGQCGVVNFHPGFVSTDTAPLPRFEEIDLVVIADGCVLEVFAANGLVTICQQIFPRCPLDAVGHTVEVG